MGHFGRRCGTFDMVDEDCPFSSVCQFLNGLKFFVAEVADFLPYGHQEEYRTRYQDRTVTFPSGTRDPYRPPRPLASPDVLFEPDLPVAFLVVRVLRYGLVPEKITAFVRLPAGAAPYSRRFGTSKNATPTSVTPGNSHGTPPNVTL